MRSQLLEITDRGLYCQPGDFYIDPWRNVPRALITHGHGDHARWGMASYLCHRLSVPILRYRIAPDIDISGIEYGERISERGVTVSFHPAGHISGSAQIRIEYRGEVAVVSGDYKVGEDKLSIPFEPVKCHTFVTESTFGLPIFKWEDEDRIAAQINSWWRENLSLGKCSLLLGYSLGKAQRLLSLLDLSIGPVYAHGSVAVLTNILREAGVPLPPLPRLMKEISRDHLRGAMILAPPSAYGGGWSRKLEPVSVAFASGWMAMRGTRRRKGVDRGFVLSDHADWEGLNRAVTETGAERVFVTHGYTAAFSRWLTEIGYDAAELSTLYGEDLEQSGSEKERSEEDGTEEERTEEDGI